VFHQKKNVLALWWRDKRETWMLSSRHTTQITRTSNRQGKEKTKPLALVDYNKQMAGVDVFGQQLSYGTLEHKAVKWWRKLAFHCFIMAISNELRILKFI
jgi:hypothetical protein